MEAVRAAEEKAAKLAAELAAAPSGAEAAGGRGQAAVRDGR